MPKLGKYSYLEIILFVAIATSVILRIVNLGSRELWYDEVLSLLLSTGQKKLYQHPGGTPVLLANYKFLLSLPIENSINDFWQTIEQFLKGLVGEPHPPLFYIGQHLWLRLFGNSVVALRSLPVLYSFGAIACGYGLGRRLLGYRGGLLLAALLGLNPFYLSHSLNVRMYCPLVFWTILSGWAISELIDFNPTKKPAGRHEIIWSLILIASIAAGFMTFYYFAFWVASLGILVLLQDRKHWLKHALRMSAGLIITTPWLLWGTRQQMNNADLGRFATSNNLLVTAWKHLQGLLDSLSANLIVGDWISITPAWGLIVTGTIAIAILLSCIYSLWRKNQHQILLIALCLSIVPLLIIIAIDVVTGKFTVGFGFGRSIILILPGCMLLIAASIITASDKWRPIIASLILIIYLSINLADFLGRSRWMFHEIADIIEQESAQPTLIVMNSNAWGHVMRLAYYLPQESPTWLLAQPSAKLAAILEPLLASPFPYQRILWLDSDRPVWGRPSTTAENQAIESVLSPRFKLIRQQKLTGTWELDNFTARLYQ
ncbi:MAG: glycosyltransferase family 39 protein [Pleurocapsa sp.]